MIAVKRARLITADMKVSRGEAGEYAREFFRNTEVHAREADVSVTTYAAEAGVSMPREYFRDVFGVLFSGVGTWDLKLGLGLSIFVLSFFRNDKMLLLVAIVA